MNELVGAPPDSDRVRQVADVFLHVAAHVDALDRPELGPYSEFVDLRWLPAKGDEQRWYPPRDLCAVYVEHLFASQARFLAFARPIQTKAQPLLNLLGIRSNPSPREVVDHLRHLAASRQPPPGDMYARLNLVADDPAVRQLRNVPCLYFESTESGDGRWLSPMEVYWGDQPFGRFRTSLGPSFARYAHLLGALGITERPEAKDAIRVPRISRQRSDTATSHLMTRRRTFSAPCWSMLSSGLEDEEVERDAVAELNSLKCVADRSGLLQRPGAMYFEDVQGIAPKLDRALHKHILQRPEGAWRAMQVAGVRNLSHAVHTEIVECQHPRDDDNLRRLLVQRTDLLARALDPVVSMPPATLRHGIDGLRLTSARSLEIRYVFESRFIRTTSDVHPVPALFNREENTLYVVASTGGRSWSAIGRELVRALCPDLAAGAGTANVVAVLGARSLLDGAEELDALGLPSLDAADLATVEGSVVDDFGGEQVPDVSDDDIPWMRPEDDTAPDDVADDIRSGEGRPHESATTGNTSGDTRGKGHAGYDAADETPAHTGPHEPLADGALSPSLAPGADVGSRDEAVRPSRSQRIQRRLRSYVLPERETTDDTPDADADAAPDERDEVDSAGVAHVMAFEDHQGRIAVEMPHHHPGYDIESRDPSGSVERYIEVKSMYGEWEAYGSGLSSTQFSTAQELGERYWLYVVQRATSDARLWMIQDPASEIDQFLFDGGWKDIADAAMPAPPPLPTVHAVEDPDDLPRDQRLPLRDLAAPPSKDGELPRIGWLGIDRSPSDELQFAVQIIGTALPPDMPRGSLAIVEPSVAEDLDDGELAVVSLAGQGDPDTGVQNTIRYWWPERDEDDSVLSLSLGAAPESGIEPIWVRQPNDIRVLGRVLRVVDPSEIARLE